MGSLLDITVGGFQLDSTISGLFELALGGRSSLYCGDLAHSFLRLLGVVFVNGELGNPVPSWPSVCCTKHMRLCTETKGLLRRAFGVIGKKPGGFRGFRGGCNVWSKALHREETMQFWT